MNPVETSAVIVGGSLLVGYLLGAHHPINGMDDLKAEVSRLREALHLEQVHEFVESNVAFLSKRRATKSRKPTTQSIWQGQDDGTLNEEATHAA